MKNVLLLIFLFIGFASNAQSDDVEKLEPYATEIPASKAIIYGQCDWLFGSVMLYRYDDNLSYIIQVKGRFMYSIPSGKYAIYSFVYGKSKWDGGIQNVVNFIYKNSTQEEVIARLKSGELKESEIERYTFIAEGGKINYIGMWNFKEKVPVFTNEKEAIDRKEQKSRYFVNFDLNNAVIHIPQ